jgi:Tfp pilus assembly protein PilF
MKDTIKQKITAALNQLQQGDPAAAIKAIDAAIELPVTPEQLRLLQKAKEEAEIGTIEAAETFLGLALNE